jgi:hypothetical protein
MRVRCGEYFAADGLRSMVVDTFKHKETVMFSVGAPDSKFAVYISDPNEIDNIIGQLFEWRRRQEVSDE